MATVFVLTERGVSRPDGHCFFVLTERGVSRPNGHQRGLFTSVEGWGLGNQAGMSAQQRELSSLHQPKQKHKFIKCLCGVYLH